MSGKQVFEELANQQPPSLFAEFWMFLRWNKKWWLLPIVILLLVIGILIAASATPLAPFIYTMF